jgi:hypothetical protein
MWNVFAKLGLSYWYLTGMAHEDHKAYEAKK